MFTNSSQILAAIVIIAILLTMWLMNKFDKTKDYASIDTVKKAKLKLDIGVLTDKGRIIDIIETDLGKIYITDAPDENSFHEGFLKIIL